MPICGAWFWRFLRSSRAHARYTAGVGAASDGDLFCCWDLGVAALGIEVADICRSDGVWSHITPDNYESVVILLRDFFDLWTSTP